MAEKKTSTITKDGLFISRKMRREALAAAAQEAEQKRIEAEDAADAADQATHAAKYPDLSDAEKTVNAEKAQAKATADARKKHGLK